MSEEDRTVECCTHGKALATFVCSHLVTGENLEWHSEIPDDADLHPDAWCGICHETFNKYGEWTEEAEKEVGAHSSIKILCSHCYENKRDACDVHWL